MKPAAKTKLMIVDDHAGTRDLIREMIGHLATEILECANGEEAAMRSMEFRPDLVTMDLNLPMTDGIETTRRILTRNPATRIVVVTQADSDKSRVEAIRAGACNFFLKDNLTGLLQYLELQQTQPPPSAA